LWAQHLSTHESIEAKLVSEISNRTLNFYRDALACAIAISALRRAEFLP